MRVKAIRSLRAAPFISWPLEIKATVRHREVLHLSATAQPYPLDAVVLRAPVRLEFTQFYTSAIISPDPVLATIARTVQLAMTSPAHGLEVSIEVRTHVVQCEVLRKPEPHSLLHELPVSRDGTGRRAVTRPEPPPGFDTMSLEDRIRLLLTPPISVELDRIGFPHDHHPKDFQGYGIAWLKDREAALLADEMGLGKTMQAIIAARLLWREKKIEHILVVCPATLVDNWEQEIRLWWGSIRTWHTHTWRGGKNKQFWIRLCTDRHVIKIISYTSLAREADWLAENRVTHDLVIIDEAQKIKNPLSGSARAVKALSGKRRWALTGTPLENRVEDVSSIFDFVEPGLIPRRDREDAAVVKKRINKYMLRRRAADVLDDLPPLSQHETAITLGDEQRKAYKRAEEEGVVALNDKGDTITVFHVFVLINNLRKLCNFDAETGKSAKLDQLTSDLEELIAEGHKALVFTQFVKAPFGLNQLAKRLRELANGAYRIDIISGEVSQARRTQIVKSFQDDESPSVLLLQYQAGGEGLNLQAARYVFLFDRWWNPAREDQAIKRAHRIGQKARVLAKKFMCVGTIEERIVEKLREKRDLFREVIDENDPAGAMGLSNEEMFRLFEDLKARPKDQQARRGQEKPDWPSINWKSFEEIVAQIYEGKGFDVERHGGSHDEGVDLLARKGDGLSTSRILIQCKRYEKPCGPDAVRSTKGAQSHDQKVTERILALWGEATKEAKLEANRSGVKIIEGRELEREAIELRLVRA